MTKKTMLLLIVSIFISAISFQTIIAQSWNITGNSNATSGSMLGTTTNVPLKFYTNNTQRVVIDSLGRVGIGTSSPVNILTVRLNGSAPAASWLGGGSSPSFMAFAEENATGFNLATAANASGFRPVLNTRRSRGTLASPTAVHNNDFLASFVSSGYDGSTFQNPATIDFYVDSVPTPGNVPGRISFVTGSNQGNRLERLKVGSTGNFNFNNSQLTITQATGNVAVGTLNTDYKVGIFSSKVESNNNTSILKLSGRNPLVGFYDESNNAYGYIKSWTNAPYAPFTNGMVIGSNPGYPIFLSTNYGATMTITNNNTVGIGTTTPTARLQVVGDNAATTPVIQATTSYVGTSDVRGILSLSKPNDGWGYGIQATGGFIGGYLNSDAGAYTGTGYGSFCNATGTAGTRIGVYGSASGGTANNWGGYFPTKTYTSELRVGGTQGATGYVAAINGRLIATEVRVELLGSWPDYVFKKGYKLMAIENLEAKINMDNHLPGIPAAGEIKENGIMLGEMQTKTIEKVEENTLYIIQLNNKIKLLEKEKEEESAFFNNKLQLLEKKIDELSKNKK